MIPLLPRLLLAGALMLGAEAAAQAPGREPAAPLEESRRALRELEKDRAREAKPSGSLGEAFPQIRAPVTGPEAPLFTPPRPGAEEEARRRRAAQENWLVRGMLDLKAAADPADPARAGGEDEEDLDPSDPEFLLKSYLRDRKQREGAEAERAGRAAPEPGSDPLAPFLDDWLAGSPVDRDVLASISGSRGGPARERGDEARRTDQGMVAAASPFVVSPESTPAVSFGLGTGGAGSAGSENPFLAFLGAPDAGGAAAPAAPAKIEPIVRTAPPPQPVVRPPARAESRPAAGPAVRNPPPSPLVENEKYFPQQKKF